MTSVFVAIRRSVSRPLMWLFPLLLIGFWLRLSFLLGSVYHTDEYISMLAAKMVAQRGLPIFPSGIFYDHGLLFSFIAGAFIRLLGFTEQVARWPVLLVSVFTIAAYYLAARRLFDSRAAGLLAATLATFDVLSIKWGVWVRMYALAHLFILLSVAWLLMSTLKRPSERGRYLFIAFLGAALFSHTLAFFTLPTLAILILIFTLVYRSDLLRSPRLWLQAIVAVVIVGVALSVVARGQVNSLPALQDPSANVPPPFGLEFLRGFFLPGLEWERFHSLIKFFQDPAYAWLLPLVALSLLAAIYRLVRRIATFADVAFLFLASFIALTIFEMAALVTNDWRKSIYMFFLTLPAFLLLSAESIARLCRWLTQWLSRLHWSWFRGRRLEAIGSVAGVALVVAVWGPEAWDTAHGQTTGDYNTAFVFVREHWHSGDKVMTEHPAAAYVYLDGNDYYANQVTAKVLQDDSEDNSLIDRYTGSPLIDTVDTLNSTLATGEHIWFVVGSDHLNKYYDSLFHAEIFAQMDLVRQFGETFVFVSRPYPRPVPAKPMTTLNGNFDNILHLGGYSLDLTAVAPDGTALLGLYWRPVGAPPSRLPKVFVQLRNGDGQTISQADHFIFEGVLPGRRWQRIQEEGDWLRDTADLPLPLPWPPDESPYRLFVGLYNPDTFERVPVLNDASGENAVVIGLPELP